MTRGMKGTFSVFTFLFPQPQRVFNMGNDIRTVCLNLEQTSVSAKAWSVEEGVRNRRCLTKHKFDPEDNRALIHL